MLFRDVESVSDADWPAAWTEYCGAPPQNTAELVDRLERIIEHSEECFALHTLRSELEAAHVALRAGRPYQGRLRWLSKAAASFIEIGVVECKHTEMLARLAYPGLKSPTLNRRTEPRRGCSPAVPGIEIARTSFQGLSHSSLERFQYDLRQSKRIFSISSSAPAIRSLPKGE